MHSIRQALLCTLFLLPLLSQAQTLKGKLFNYLDEYDRTDQKLKRSTLDSMRIDSDLQQVNIYVSGGFKEQFFTSEVVDGIYSDIRALMPDSLLSYNLKVLTDGHTIECLIPNALRQNEKSTERIWPTTYKGAAWVRNTSAPWKATQGLDGMHIALWQSHGYYWNPDNREWKWQRPRLFCTTEDLFTQTFVIPYIIPMLENAGAIVYDTRERSWQNHEVIVDNDAPDKDGKYREDGRWHVCESAGFAHLKDTYYLNDNPFTDGTTRYTATTQANRQSAQIDWTPDIPEDGDYAVYVSYKTIEGSVSDARYTVTHKGVKTEFRVNQQMGGDTWVYLGTFSFAKGCSDENKVTLTNQSSEKGVVTADAVRFGGGMGNIARANSETTNKSVKSVSQSALTDEDLAEDNSYLYNYKVSGMPRWAEAARYYSQWAGMPDYIYNHTESDNDYNNDLWSRPETVNTLAGGSVYEPNRNGRNVPLELAVAFHSDAGFSTIGEYIGSLTVCSSNFYEGKTDAGIDRFASYDLASMLLGGLNSDLKKYQWPVRTLWNRNYCETREPQIPAVILEMLSHQNFDDLRLGYDPKFKFDFCRSVYKTIVRYLATQHGRSAYTIQPLPIHNFAITLNDQGQWANLTWDATPDPLEPSAMPDKYVVYTRKDDGDFDNGRIVDGTSYIVKLEKGHLYSFRICALNDGGISFPSETLCAYSAHQNSGTILLVNAFSRLEGPAQISTGSEQGFDIDYDPGVQYGKFAGFCGSQLVFDKTHMGSEAKNGTGYSGSELEGHIIGGNTFDYVSLHGKGISQLGTHSFCSCSEEAFVNNIVVPIEYQMIDVIYGVQKEFNPRTAELLDEYLSQGGNMLVSGANMFVESSFGHKKLHAVYHETLTDKSVTSVNGSNLDFSIYREMNAESYAVPRVLSLKPDDFAAFAMLQYSTSQPAAIAYDGLDYRAITVGFPIESIRENDKRNLLMQAITTFLCR